MEVDNKSEIIDINSDSDCDISSDKPLFDWLKYLISSENKNKTVLTNRYLSNILQMEFHYDIKNLHSLQIEIFLSILKTSIKNWPDWGTFEKMIDEIKNKGKDHIDGSAVEKTYDNLKVYLKQALDFAEPLAKEKVEMIKKNMKTTRQDVCKANDPVLEIHATQRQLLKLFFRHPNRKSNNAVFNTFDDIPSQISVFTPTIRSILNWWGISLTATLPSEQNPIFKRETDHDFKYILLNKRLLVKENPPQKLDQSLQYKGCIDKTIEIISVQLFFEKVFSYLDKNDQMRDLLSFLIIDLKLLPPELFTRTSYRRYTNNYPYVRHLYQEIENPYPEDVMKYDLQLEETISPRYSLYLGDFSNAINKINAKSAVNVFNITCNNCAATFKGPNFVMDLLMHFSEKHHSEKNYNCTNCEKDFPIEELTKNWWYHDCPLV